MHLWMNFYLERPLFDQSQLKSLHGLICAALPQWSSGLQVFKSEYKRKGQYVGCDGNLFDAINRESPMRRGIGNAVLKGSYGGLSFFLNTCGSTSPPELNYVSVEVEHEAIEGKELAVVAFNFFKEAARCLPLRYAKAYLSEEFDEKNLVSDENGVRAVGTHLEVCLPGIYWLNFFGSPYVKLVGLDRLITAPAQHTEEMFNGVLVVLDTTPTRWSSDAYKLREAAVTEHIGDRYFYSRSEPDRDTAAPKFTSERH